jgi:hypothetical protein
MMKLFKLNYSHFQYGLFARFGLILRAKAPLLFLCAFTVDFDLLCWSCECLASMGVSVFNLNVCLNCKAALDELWCFSLEFISAFDGEAFVDFSSPMLVMLRWKAVYDGDALPYEPTTIILLLFTTWTFSEIVLRSKSNFSSSFAVV